MNISEFVAAFNRAWHEAEAEAMSRSSSPFSDSPNVVRPVVRIAYGDKQPLVASVRVQGRTIIIEGVEDND